MTPARDSSQREKVQDAEAGLLQSVYEAKAAEEIRAADSLAPGSDAVRWRGALLAEVAVVKGLAGPAEASGGDAVSGPDGEKIVRALEALGYESSQLFFTLSRPDPAIDQERRASRLRRILEAVDAETVIAMDPEAAEDVSNAFGIGELRPGAPVRAGGRRLVALSGFEASLADKAAKERIWRELQPARKRGSVF